MYTFTGTFGTSASSISNSVSRNLCLCPQKRFTPCPIGAIIVNGPSRFPFVTCSACEALPLVVVLLLPGSPRIHIEGPVLLPQVSPVAIGLVLRACNLLWVSEHHQVSRYHQPADASQHRVSTELLARAELVDNSNVSQTNVDNVLCLLTSCRRVCC